MLAKGVNVDYTQPMSQSHNPTDTQALLQSMLQRLKLQPGREALVCPSPVPITTASRPVNGFTFNPNGSSLNAFGTSPVDSNFAGGVKQPGLDCKGDKGLLSSSTQKDNTDGGTGDNGLSAQATQPAISPPGMGQLFPAVSLKDVDIASFGRTDQEKQSFDSSAITRHTPDNKEAMINAEQTQGFTPRAYVWSLKPDGANVDAQNQQDKVLHMGNGGLGTWVPNQDTQIVTSDQKPTNISSRKKQRPSESKTRRWTQKIKERWRDRPGSFGKKAKVEEQRDDSENEKGTQILSQIQSSAAETVTNTSKEMEGRGLPSAECSDATKTPLTHTEDDTNIRTTSDFELGLGSFSLLDEIVTGQEWAKFLNPNQSSTSTSQGPSETPQNPTDGRPFCVKLSPQGAAENQLSFRPTEALLPGPDLSPAPASHSVVLPTSMDISERAQQQQFGHRGADQSEPMDHGHIQSDKQPGDSRTPTFVKPVDILNNSVLKSNRKRQHAAVQKMSKADQEGSAFSVNSSSSHMMEEAGESHAPNSPPTPLSPSSPFAHPPKGVLKHSISQDSECSMELMTKRRRVEENRRVRFAENMVTIVPPVLDLDVSDSDGSSVLEEDSMTEQEWEAEPPGAAEALVVEDVAPARRHALPTWILTLKRKKHR